MNIKSTILSCSLLLFGVLSGCVNLNEDLTGQPTADKFFKNIEDFNSFIAGAYIPIVKLYGTDAPYVAGAGAEDVHTPIVRWKGFEEVNINSVGNPDEVTSELWRAYYTSISSCNTMLTIIRDSKLSAEILMPIDGEARFLRAFNYFNLVRWFGEVPLLLEDNQMAAATEPQSSLSEIYACIESDLKSAEQSLPPTQADKTKPTRWAAKALLAKVYMAMAGFPLNRTELYTLARNKAEEVIAQSPSVYDLEQAYFSLWRWNNRLTNKEFLFALYANSANATGGYVNRAVRPSDYGEGGWGDWNSDKRFLAQFPIGDKSRLDGTFYLTMLDGTSWEDTDTAQPYVGKLRDGGEKTGGYLGPPTANLADGFYCMIRFSDVLLTYAEAANLSEGSPSTAAYEAINRVRRRAGLNELSGLSPEAFDKAVLDERNWELAFEVNRWFDLCRRHKLKETIGPWYPNSVIDDHNYLLPKPYDQLSTMIGVKQNPGY